MGLPPRPALTAAPPPAAPHRVSTGAAAAPHARGRRPRPPGCGRDGGGCEGSGAAPPGCAFTRSPPQQVCSRHRGYGRSRRRRKRRVRGRQRGRPPPIAPRRGPCCRGPASAQRRQPRTGAGVREQRAAAASYIAGGAAPPAPSNRCRCRSGCPPARGGGAAVASLRPPSRTHQPSDRGGAGPPRLRAPPHHCPPPLSLQASGGARAHSPPHQGSSPSSSIPARSGVALGVADAPLVLRLSPSHLAPCPLRRGAGRCQASRGLYCPPPRPSAGGKCRWVPELGVREGPGRPRRCRTGAQPERAGSSVSSPCTAGEGLRSAASSAAVRVRIPPHHTPALHL
ncbi:uncharacterized protein LOC113947903 [Corapipo altera]|uniref:uncharacterized protein LOC113947903 n=1 Tax=Corapipo altera TaxID=415028 RepID=UPI000FD67D18|nr:uncharacterized protein LOC113947903 [Corapipo altera]